MTPIMVVGQEVGLGFDPEWMTAQVVGRSFMQVQQRCRSMQEQRARSRNNIVERLRRADLTPEEDDVGKAILRAFATAGKAPSVEDVAQALGLPVELVRGRCRKLAACDLIVWTDEAMNIVSAYPFSGVPTAHQVSLDGHSTLYAMCAVDALGIPFMVGQGARVRPVCFLCQQPVTVDIDRGLLKGAHPSTLVVWSSERDGCCVAEARCPLMNFFCAEAHLRAWLTRSPGERGTSLSLREALDVGQAAFGGLLG